MSNQFISYLKLIAALLIWAGLYHIAKPAAMASGPYLLAFFRFLLAAFLWLIILRVRRGQIWFALTRTQCSLVILIGLIGVCAYNVFFLSAESLISGNIVALLYAFAPCLTTLLSALIFKMRLNRLSIIGIIIALSGSIAVINLSDESCNQVWCSSMLATLGRGELFAILATVAFACYSILNKLAAQQGVPAIIINAYSSIFGALFLGVITLFKVDYHIVGQLDMHYWLAVVYIALIATVLAYFWYTEALIQLGVLRTVILQNTIPLLTIALGFLFFKQQVSLGVLLSGLVVLAGVYLTSLAMRVK